MANEYLFFDGTNYINPCDCNVSVYIPGNVPQLINPNNCVIKYYDGANWCNLVCPCECPEGYEFSFITNSCIRQESAVYTGSTSTLAQGHQDSLYTNLGLRLYPDLSSFTLPLAGNVLIDQYDLVENNGAGAIAPPAIAGLENRLWGIGSGTCTQNATQGRLNTVGIWPTGVPKGTEISFEYCIDLVYPKQYLFGMSGDDMTLAIDSGSGFVDQVRLRNSIVSTNYEYYWWVFPITLPAGNHIIRFSGQDLWDTVGNIGFEIYDMGDLTTGPNSPYAAPYDKFVDFLTTPATTSPDCGNDEDSILSFIEFTSGSLTGFDIATPGSAGTWSCPDGSPVDECNGTPQCIDEIPCDSENPTVEISSVTEINIWFDASGSMNTTLDPLEEMISGIDGDGNPSQFGTLRECLLPIYNNDSALFDERVKIFNFIDEQFVSKLGTGRNFNRNADTNVNQVINLTFADESDPYGVGQNDPIIFDNTVQTAAYANDIAYTRNQQIIEPYDIKGTAFRVATIDVSTAPWPQFRALTRATFVNSGIYAPNLNLNDYYQTKYNVNLDTLPAEDPEYYRDIIREALNALGLNIPVCP